MFVKPNALGSSIGISKVTDESARSAAAIDDAFQYDRKVLIEASCEGREFECAVLGNDRPEASIPGEIVIKGPQILQLRIEVRRSPGSEVRIPADFRRKSPSGLRASVAAFKALSLRGMARVDFLARRDLASSS